jgi:hypothetical protein
MRIVWVLWSLAAGLAAAAPASAQSGSESTAAMIVSIAGPLERGTGIVIDVQKEHATILTASHVVEGGSPFSVVFAGAPERGAFEVSTKDVIGLKAGQKDGLAVFRVRGDIPPAVRCAVFRTGDPPDKGTPLVYWGFPNQADTLRAVTGAVGGRSGDLLLMDRSIGQGGSGGPLLADREIVGIVTSNDQQQTSAVVSDVALSTMKGWGVKPCVDTLAPEKEKGKEKLISVSPIIADSDRLRVTLDVCRRTSTTSVTCEMTVENLDMSNKSPRNYVTLLHDRSELMDTHGRPVRATAGVLAGDDSRRNGGLPGTPSVLPGIAVKAELIFEVHPDAVGMQTLSTVWRFDSVTKTFELQLRGPHAFQ